MPYRFPIPYDGRKYNGYKPRSKAAAQYLEDNVIENFKGGAIWTMDVKHCPMKLEISISNVSGNEGEPIYRPILKFCIPNFLPWTDWDMVSLNCFKNSSEAKQYALTKFCASYLPGAVEYLFPSVLAEKNEFKSLN